MILRACTSSRWGKMYKYAKATIFCVSMQLPAFTYEEQALVVVLKWLNRLTYNNINRCVYMCIYTHKNMCDLIYCGIVFCLPLCWGGKSCFRILAICTLTFAGIKLCFPVSEVPQVGHTGGHRNEWLCESVLVKHQCFCTAAFTPRHVWSISKGKLLYSENTLYTHVQVNTKVSRFTGVQGHTAIHFNGQLNGPL